MYPHRIRLRGPWEYEPRTRTVVDFNGVRPEAGNVPPAGRLKIPNSWQGTPLEGFAGRVQFRRAFRSPRTLDSEEHVWLVFEGVDYFADAFLNGERLGQHAGYFEAFQFEITPLLKPRNEIIVNVDMPREADPRARRLFRGPGDGIGGGIWNDVVLEIRPGVRLRDVRLRSCVIEQRRDASDASPVPRWATSTDESDADRKDGGQSPPYNGSANPLTFVDLHVFGEVVGEFPAPLTLDFSLNGRSLGHRKVNASPTGHAFEFSAPAGDLLTWQTWDLGKPAVHPLRVELHGAARTLDAWTVSFGHRDFQAAHATGEEPKIVRLESSSASWDQLVSAWRAEGVTCLRIPGHVLPAELYDALDRAGISLWQDFPASPEQADDTDTVAEAVRQARALVRGLRHHPSIAAWCCGAADRPSPTRLETAVRKAIQEEDPDRPCRLPQWRGRE